MHGIIPKDHKWTEHRVLDLYVEIMKTKRKKWDQAQHGSSASSIRIEFPPPEYEATRSYLPISYRQNDSDYLPQAWAASVVAVVNFVSRDTGVPHGLWFDKLGSLQYATLQKYWAALANLHYAVRPVLHVTPRVGAYHALQRADAASRFPVAALSQSAYETMCDWLVHHADCTACQRAFSEVAESVGFEQGSHLCDPVNWAEPGAYFRTWPMVERALSSLNRGAVSTYDDVAALACSSLALHALFRTSKEVRAGQNLPYSPILHVHRISVSYSCEQALAIAAKWPEPFDSTLVSLAERFAMDATRIQPVDVPQDGSESHIAQVVRGMRSGTAARLQPMFAYTLRKRFVALAESAGQSIDDEMLDMSPARREILSGWGGRAPCFSQGDKIEALSVFANFSTVSGLMFPPKGGEEGEPPSALTRRELWKGDFVRMQYARRAGVMGGVVDVSTDMMPKNRFHALDTSKGLCGAEPRAGELFGRYAGCVGVNAFAKLLEEIGATASERKEFAKIEQEIWNRETEQAGRVYMIGPSAEERRCPVCSTDGTFQRVGTIFRSKQSRFNKHRFWAIGHRALDEIEQVTEGEAVCCMGEMHASAKFGTKCSACGNVAERVGLRGWPREMDVSWEGVLVPNESHDSPAGEKQSMRKSRVSLSRLSNISGIEHSRR